RPARFTDARWSNKSCTFSAECSPAAAIMSSVRPCSSRESGFTASSCAAAATQSRTARALQLTLEEPHRPLIRLSPATVQQKVVDLVRKDQFLYIHLSFPQSISEYDGLVELYVAVIIALNQ